MIQVQSNKYKINIVKTQHKNKKNHNNYYEINKKINKILITLIIK